MFAAASAKEDANPDLRSCHAILVWLGGRFPSIAALVLVAKTHRRDAEKTFLLVFLLVQGLGWPGGSARLSISFLLTLSTSLAYCTVRVSVVICVRAPDVAVTTMEAGAGLVGLLAFFEPPHPVDASSVPAISRAANPPSSSENKRRRPAPAPARKQPKTPSPVNAIPISLVAT